MENKSGIRVIDSDEKPILEKELLIALKYLKGCDINNIENVFADVIKNILYIEDIISECNKQNSVIVELTHYGPFHLIKNHKDNNYWNERFTLHDVFPIIGSNITNIELTGCVNGIIYYKFVSYFIAKSFTINNVSDFQYNDYTVKIGTVDDKHEVYIRIVNNPPYANKCYIDW